MAAKDLFHGAVKQALLKEQWTIDSLFQERFVQEAVRLYQIKLIVYDPNKEVVREWIN